MSKHTPGPWAVAKYETTKTMLERLQEGPQMAISTNHNPDMRDEKLAKDILKRTYLAGRNKHTYVEMGCAGNYEEIYEEKQSN